MDRRALSLFTVASEGYRLSLQGRLMITQPLLSKAIVPGQVSFLQKSRVFPTDCHPGEKEGHEAKNGNPEIIAQTMPSGSCMCLSCPQSLEDESLLQEAYLGAPWK